MKFGLGRENHKIQILQYITIYSMTRKTSIAILLTVVIAAATIPVFASGICVGTCIEGSQPCKFLCFDPIKNSATQGFDPSFLIQSTVKTSCQEAFNDGEKLPYCDKALGTL